jgi:hypothetical protein
VGSCDQVHEFELRGILQKSGTDRASGIRAVGSQRGVDVVLWVEVDKQDTPVVKAGQRTCQIDSGSGFADTAFLSGDGDDPSSVGADSPLRGRRDQATQAFLEQVLHGSSVR